MNLSINDEQKIFNLDPIVVEQTEDLGFGLGQIVRRDVRPAISAVEVPRLGLEKLLKQIKQEE